MRRTDALCGRTCLKGVRPRATFLFLLGAGPSTQVKHSAGFLVMLRSYRSKFNETTEVDVIEWVC